MPVIKLRISTSDFRLHITSLVLVIIAGLALAACSEKQAPLTEECLTFSQDTLNFDTIFTNQGSITKQIKIYNYTTEVQRIDHIVMLKGNYFQVNIDGINDLDLLSNTTLSPRDSMFVFIKVFITELHTDLPQLISDKLVVQTTGAKSGNTTSSSLYLMVHGQDVDIIDSLYINSDTTFTGIKPRLVYNYIYVDSLSTLTLSAGTKLILHDSAQIVIRGTLLSQGTAEEPVVVRGDKLYHLFEAVPYDYVSGLWGGVFIIQPNDNVQRHHRLEYTNIHGANYGLYCYSRNIGTLSDIEISSCYIHNCSQYGLTLQNYNSKVTNSEISNAAFNCVYLAGGKHEFVHNTIANYFNNTNIRMHYVGRQYVASLMVNNLSKNNSRTEVLFVNNIIAGREKDNMVLATPLPRNYKGLFSHNYIMADSIGLPCFENNVFGSTTDTVFVNTFYSRTEQQYYDFRLDSLSPAIGIADTTYSKLYPIDRVGNPRTLPADAGCYQTTSE